MHNFVHQFDSCAKQISSTVGIFNPTLFVSSVIVVLETSGRLPLKKSCLLSILFCHGIC